MVRGLELGPRADGGAGLGGVASVASATPSPAACPAGYADALAYRVPVVAMNRHLPWLLGAGRRPRRAVRRAAGSSAWTRPWQPARSVVNATGLGARELVPDPVVYPVRGQVLRLSNPGTRRSSCSTTTIPAD